ncbi:hypothetical protein Lal_00019973 [Lupinus albus]|nr:hypothetical protein Lal_00019973 [Lupinus albus]
MTLERRFVLVGIRIDSYSRHILNWAIFKVAEPGDYVIAVNVVKNPDYVPKNKSLIAEYLEVYEGLCDVKKVGLIGQVFTGSSFRSILVREAKNHAAMALVVGGRTSTAKYCSKRLPPNTNVLAIQDSRIVFRRCTNNQLPGGLLLDPRPSLRSIGNLSDRVKQSESDDCEVESEKPRSQNRIELKEEASNRLERRKLRSSSMFSGDPSEQKLGWPLLRRAKSEISSTHHHVRDMSVVQWVMSLPDRSPKKSPHSCSSIEENPSQRGISDKDDESSKNYSATYFIEVPKGLEGKLSVNSLHCKWFSLELLKSCTAHFSSENLIGKGGSNRVYKGVLPDGKLIAVKVLKSTKEALKDFALEVEIISSLKHKNITSLLGICIEDNALISVYDYFPKGSLEENLHGKVAV